VHADSIPVNQNNNNMKQQEQQQQLKLCDNLLRMHYLLLGIILLSLLQYASYIPVNQTVVKQKHNKNGYYCVIK
jgi:hypothetical protein